MAEVMQLTKYEYQDVLKNRIVNLMHGIVKSAECLDTSYNNLIRSDFENVMNSLQAHLNNLKKELKNMDIVNGANKSKDKEALKSKTSKKLKGAKNGRTSKHA